MPEKMGFESGINHVNRRYGNQPMTLVGTKCGLLTVLSAEPTRRLNGRVEKMWLCLCECGNKKIVQRNNLRSGHTKSCGCLTHHPWHVTHGLTHHPLYHVWASMKDRCLSPDNQNYKNYGGRGIPVCAEWAESLQKFVDDMEPTYQPGLTLDRIDNSRGYCKDNCKWSTRREQQNNTRTNHNIAWKGEVHTIAEWARIKNMKQRTLHTRLKLGWSIDRALSEPVRNQVRIYNE